ncbi:MAG TPA: hypothetical protein VFF40_04425, partial [Acidimicrobiia bacterium]|nr:hypothetical protein [Acidimicrobiia bacterium]
PQGLGLLQDGQSQRVVQAFCRPRSIRVGQRLLVGHGVDIIGIDVRRGHEGHRELRWLVVGEVVGQAEAVLQLSRFELSATASGAALFLPLDSR